MSSWHSVVCMRSAGHAGRTGGNYICKQNSGRTTSLCKHEYKS